MGKSIPLEERFWSKVDRRGDDECWPWTGGRDRDGYGQIALKVDGRRTSGRATAVALQLHGTHVERGQPVLHSCDNPPCVNPAHLTPGTTLMNNRDKVIKGRHKGPPTIAGDRMTAAKVIEIRNRHAAGETTKVLAEEFGVTRSHISKICRRDQWSHI